MAGKIPNINYEQLVLKLLKDSLSEKHREVIRRRFGIGQNEKETLEKIGEDYGVTRERIRQVEAVAFENLKRDEIFFAFSGPREALRSYIDAGGFIMREDRLFSESAPSRHYPSIVFILTISPEFHYISEDERVYPSWTTEPETANIIVNFLGMLHEYLDGRSELVAENEFVLFMLREARRVLPQKVKTRASDYLDISKTVRRTLDGQYGLNHWPEVNPKGVRDKSYIVLKKNGKPLHFKKISDLINTTEFSSNAPTKRAHPQTVHNELIKDGRFVLVGRGTYALRDWGYEPGTVKEVIQRIVAESEKPLTKDEILKRVLEKRFVKENTVLLNLQDKNLFSRLPSGEFTFVDK